MTSLSTIIRKTPALRLREYFETKKTPMSDMNWDSTNPKFLLVKCARD